MATKNNAPSMLQGFSRFLKPASVVTSQPRPANPMPANPLPKVDDDLQFLPHSPYADGVHVSEVDQAEFLKEWGRAVTQKALARSGDEEEADALIDRRLPHFERRYTVGERREANKKDRRHNAPWPAGQAHHEHRAGTDDRREGERRTGQDRDRRVPTLILKVTKPSSAPSKT